MAGQRLFLFLGRLIKIQLVVLRLLFNRRLTRPVRFRMFFEQAGGAFLKLGQILSLRQDFIPPAYANELLNLLSRVESLPWPKMRAVFLQEIGRPPEEVFRQFDDRPIASASISQVYRAQFANGERVAVKIQRPNVRKVFETDFRSEFFRQFDDRPIASASISQVYRAQFANGERVAVKIQRPNVRKVFETDF